MAWNGFQLTRQGMILNSKIILGQTELLIAKVAAGDGTATGPVVDLTDLVHETLPMPIITRKRLPDGTALFSTLFSNRDLQTGFYFRELGVWATDPELGDILYGYDFYGPDPQWIPAAGSAVLINTRFNLGMKISSTMDVEIKLDDDWMFVPIDPETGKADLDYLPDIGGVKTVNNKSPDAAGNVALTAEDIPQQDGRSIEAAQAEQDAAIDTLDAFSTVWPETSTSTTERTVYIPGVENLDQLINRPIFVRASVAGAAGAATLEVNGLGAYSLYVHNPDGQTMLATLQHLWVGQYQTYCVVWDGTVYRLVSTGYPAATTARRGITQLNNTLTSSATDQALTAAQGAALATILAGQESQIMQMWDALFNDITTNPFLITFGTLDGITLTSGVWNRTLQRLEC